MKKHTQVYLKHFNLGETDYMYCEACGTHAVDVHHLNRRGMGGSKTKDNVENLMGLCRKHHDLAEASPKANEKFKTMHATFLLINPYNNPDINWDKIFERNLQLINKL